MTMLRCLMAYNGCMNREEDTITETLAVVRQGVAECLSSDTSGHNVDHVERVYALAMRFCDRLPAADRLVVGLAALLHDVDDYKLVGRERAETLQNAVDIMDRAAVVDAVQAQVKQVIGSMGYSKALRGVRPSTLEGMIVSDADMCDAIGASGITRTLMYAVSDKGSGVVFDKTVWPNVDMAAHEYNAAGTTHDGDSFINHFFEKLLKVRGMMLTTPGGEEAMKRELVMIEFLRAFFYEQNAPEWIGFLDDYVYKRVA